MNSPTDESMTVLGLGRVGLPVALCLAETGSTVYGIDKDKGRVELLRAGKIPFYEPGLGEILACTLGKTFLPTNELGQIRKTSCSIVAVNAPMSRGKMHLSDLNGALDAIAKNMERGHLIIIKTTLAPGMTEGYVRVFLEKASNLKGGRDFSLAYVPERLIEGQAIRIIREIPTVIGAIDDASYRRTSAIFRKLGNGSNKRVTTKAAEVAKLLENSWRDVAFALANEAGLICRHLGVDALEAIEAANYENPWSSIPIPSVGIGGACLPKDPIILATSSKRMGYIPRLLLAARRLNNKITEHVFAAIRQTYGKTGRSLRQSRVLLLGLAYKKGTDDTRNTPAEKLIQRLKAAGALVMAYDPYVSDDDFRKLAVRKIELTTGLRSANCIVLVTNHDQFKKLDVSPYIRDDCIVADFWGMWNPKMMKKGIYCGWSITSRKCKYHGY